MSKEEMNRRGFETILVEENYDKVLEKFKEAVELYIELDCVDLSAEAMMKSKSSYTKLQVLLFQKLLKDITKDVAMLEDLRNITADKMDNIVEGCEANSMEDLILGMMISSIMD